MKVFLSYAFKDESFVQRVSYLLQKQPDMKPYCFADAKGERNFVHEVGIQIGQCEAFVLFLIDKVGETQEVEAGAAIANKKRLVLVKLGMSSLPASLNLYVPGHEVPIRDVDESHAYMCAERITRYLIGRWIPDDDLPIGYPFEYEKDIIIEYGKRTVSSAYIEKGCPEKWPSVKKFETKNENPVPESEIGDYRDVYKDQNRQEHRRDKDPTVAAVGLTELDGKGGDGKRLTFVEAGPRKFLHRPTNANRILTVGVLVSGGIAPGINAVINGIVKRHYLYAERGHYTRLNVLGYQNGLSALVSPGPHHRALSPQATMEEANLGGSMLGTSRVPQFADPDPSRRRQVLDRAVQRLRGDGVEILYIVGGDGSMRVAHALWHRAHETSDSEDLELSVVGIPKTMDNDILWVWQSFGSLSAVEKAKEAIQQLQTEARSNPRLCVIQLFGSDSGFVVTHAVLGSGVCDLFLIPEVLFSLKGISEYMTTKLKNRYIDSASLQSTYGVIVMAESAIPLDAEEYLDNADVGLSKGEKCEIRRYLRNGRVFGQTPDELRSGGLKLVSRVLQRRIREMPGDPWPAFRVFTNEPRHLIRAIPPSSLDIIFGQRLGSLSVDCAMAGYTDFMISQWLTEYVMVPLKLVVLGRKRIPRNGIFLKSVRANTGQLADLR